MANDRTLADLDIPAAVVGRLKDLAIRGVRQLYARLKREAPALQDYLQLADATFADFRRRVEDAVRKEYPEDLFAKTHPPVNKQSVAVHRLHDPQRPRFGQSEEE
jgi:hypothetical protein